MGYSAALGKMKDYRDDHISSLMDEKSSSWFASLWGSISAMLDTFNSDEENGEISSQYAKGKSLKRIPANLKLDYVCGLRRDIRKQYVSGEGDIYTDVTPFRHGIMSAHGSNIFDDALDQVLQRGDRQ